jgi:ATP-dependent 26S proteasome regulatory subunit
MNLSDTFVECVASGQPFMTVLTADFCDVESDISKVCKGGDFSWDLWVWDSDRGLVDSRGVVDLNPKPAQSAITPKPGMPAALQQAIGQQPQPKLRAIQALMAAVEVLMLHKNKENPDDPDEQPLPTILIVRDLHRYWRLGSGPENDNFVHHLITRLRHFNRLAKATSKHIIGLMPDCEAARVPPELESDVTVIRHALPLKDEYKPIIGSIEVPGKKLEFTEVEEDQIAEASCGLTRQQAESTYAIASYRYLYELDTAKKNSKSPVSVGKFYVGVVEEKKNEILNVDGIITKHNGHETFDDIGGNDALKEFLMRAMNPSARRRPSRLRAVGLVGPPGCGKSLTLKALGNALGIQAFNVDLGKCKGRYVGDTESGVRKLYARMDAMAPIIAIYDEVNEQISAGSSDDHSTDKSILGTTLVWLNDHTSDVFVGMSANDISTMHMALMRPGRVDAIWYVGLPGVAQKQRIWEICMAKYKLEEQDLPKDINWAGAEIDACCRMADALSISIVEAARYIIPTAVRMESKITDLKNWAEGRCLDAETGDTYHRDRELPPEATGSLGIGTRVRRKVRKA